MFLSPDMDQQGAPGASSPLGGVHRPGPRGGTPVKLRASQGQHCLEQTQGSWLKISFYLEITSKFTTKLEIKKNHTKNTHLPFTRLYRH